MTERSQLEEAIAALEVKRGFLGDSIVEKALAPLRERLAALDAASRTGVHTALQPTASAAGERRVVTILFCDVKGSTAMAEQLDPEEWAGIIQRALEYVTEPVRRHGGTVAEVRGDGILALFGAPVAHEDDPQRSVIAGLEILEGIQNFRQQIKHARGLDFNVRVGIHTGLVVVGEVGGEQQVEYTAIGDAVNLAARMEQTGRPGTVQISHQTYRLVEHMFECQPLGEIKVKGKRKPVRAYRVISLKAQPGPLRGLERQGLHSPLVGREAEFATLKECLDRVIDGQGGIVGIFGEAGIGKSRLIAEVQVSAANLLWLEGHTLSFGQTISYWPFQQILRDWSGIAEDDSESQAWAKLEQKVQALFAEDTIDYLPYLASLLALQVKGEYAERVKYLDGEALGKQIFLTARRFFERLAREQPTVIVFEDLHWMDESSTNLLDHLLPLIERLPILILGLSRTERHTPAARLLERSAREYAGRYIEIWLEPLSIADSMQLVHNLLEIEDLPAHLRELIVAKAEGNPFFLEEVIRTLVDSGVVRRDRASGRLQAMVPIESLHIPDTIQGVILARVDRLDEQVKQVLRVAAVIGRSFLYRVLQAIAEAEQRLDDSLAELQQTELIREKRVTPELEYIFKHALAQEATYESILLQKRRELHARVGQAIEALFAGRLEEFYGLLAYHYARAEAWEKAQDYLLKAGDQAGSIAADAEALNHYEQAIKVYAHAFGDKWDPQKRASLERKIGEAFARRGEYPQALEHFRRAMGYFGYHMPISGWGVRRALGRELVAHVGRRLRPQAYLESFAESGGPDLEEEAYICVYTAYINMYTDPQRFLLLSLRSLNLSERRGYPFGVVFGSLLLGVILDFSGLFGLARWYHHRAVNMAEKIQQPFALGMALAGSQVHEMYSGELDRSIELGQNSAQAYRAAGRLEDWGIPTSLLAFAFAHRGDFSGALALSQELIRFGQDAGARSVWCWGETAQGYIFRRQGQLQQAITRHQKAIELAETIRDHLYRTIAGSDLGLCCLQQGDFLAALSELETCRQVAAEHHVIGYGVVTMLNNLAETYLFAVENGDTSERSNWLSKAKLACRAALKESLKNRPKWPKALRLQGTYEWLSGKPAAAQKWWQKSLAEAERMGLRYDVGMTHLEIGQRLGNPIHLEKAEAIFAEIGAVTIESTSLPANHLDRR